MSVIGRSRYVLAVLPFAVIAIVGIRAIAVPESVLEPVTVSSRLVSIQEFPTLDACAWEAPAGTNSDRAASLRQGGLFSTPQQPMSASSLLMASFLPENLVAALGQQRAAARAGGGDPRIPVRTIRDEHPGYSAIAVDLNSDEVILQDNNLWSYRVFNRLDNTPPGREMTEPKRVVMGPDTEIQFNNGLYVDPVNGDIYSVESDVGDRMVVFRREADGNVEPMRNLETPHRVYSIAADEENAELFVTVEYPPKIVVYRKQAEGEEPELRRIQGENTGLEAPHGIAVDEKNQLLYVNNWGYHSNFLIEGTGRFNPPSIKVYPLDAIGDTPPLRVITGDRTQLNWPAAMKLNPDTGELYVANDIGQSILVFADVARAEGNVAPVRVLKGPQTLLSYPTGVFVDVKNQELWVSNLGNASATVYPLMADGDVAPLRTIRSAPEGKQSLNFGRTAALAYDPIRQQILVPN